MGEGEHKPPFDYLDTRLKGLLDQEVSVMFHGDAKWWGPYTLTHVGDDYIVLRGNHEYWINTVNILVVRPENGEGPGLAGLRK